MRVMDALFNKTALYTPHPKLLPKGEKGLSGTAVMTDAFILQAQGACIRREPGYDPAPLIHKTPVK